MIIVQLMGGLGNQLFQYAIARRLAFETGQPFKLDLTGYDTDHLRAYSLAPFNVRHDVATLEEIGRVKPLTPDPAGRLSPARFLRTLKYSRTWIRERTPYVYDRRVLRARGDVYLEGYWANEKYFKNIETVIREEFTVTAEPTGDDLAAARAIQRVAAVGLHVRRGDYAQDSVTRSFHGLASVDYYREAVARLTATVRDPHFFVFSDDADWVRQHLRLDYPTTYVTHNTADRGHEDLRLMALCRHHIIANSSFSWWGAWLGRHPEQLVFAPAKWLNRPEIDTSDATPAHWIKV